MARLTDNVRQALGKWWDLAYKAGYGDYTATDAVSAAADIANQQGGALSFGEGSAIATLYGYARRMSNAADVVQGLQPEDVIGPDAMSTPPWARDQIEQDTMPMWHVHFDLTTVDEAGNVSTSRKVSVFHFTLADTFGELQTKIIADAQAMALKYNQQFVDASIMEIQSV